MVVILLGPPGAGKGTQAVRLIDSVGGEHVSTGDLLREACRDGTDLGLEAQEFMNKGELVPDLLILDLIRDHLSTTDSETNIVFDGFPRTIAQAEGLDGVLLDVARGVSEVVVFEAPEDQLIKRLSGRRSCIDCGAVFNLHFDPPTSEGECGRCGGLLVQRSDDQPDTVRNRLRVYESQTAPLIDHYSSHPASLKRVPAAQPVHDVQLAFRAALGIG
ncbi:MAG TPA: adenylate kinase [Gemmatimonadetes bacterium]|nr:adenylate kinase [Gemmatimonadota bacterium]HIL90201.1 adenylate kinase [Gemmatimonadota bacterium]